MTTIVTRAGKGSSLTWAEGDANFTNLNNDKAEMDYVDYQGSGSAANINSFGTLNNNGTTDDAAVFQAAAASGYSTILAQGLYCRIGSVINIPAGQTWILTGTRLTLNDATSTVFKADTVDDWALVGPFSITGTGSTVGTAKGVHVTGCNRWRIENYSAKSIKGWGLYIEPGTPSGTLRGDQGFIHNFRAENCYFGYEDTPGTGAEYTTLVAPYITGCYDGLKTAAGNVTIYGGQIVDNTNDGLILAAGANHGHGLIIGTNINHNDRYNVFANSVTNGYDLVGCHIYGEASTTTCKIYLYQSAGICIRDGEIDTPIESVSGGSSAFNYITNNYCPGSYGDVEMTGTGLTQLAFIDNYGPGAYTSGISINTPKPVYVRAYRNPASTQSLVSATEGQLIWNSESSDRCAAYDNTTGTFTVPTAQSGVYRIRGQAVCGGTSVTNVSYLTTKINNTDTFLTTPGLYSNNKIVFTFDHEVNLANTDTVKIYASVTATNPVFGDSSFYSWVVFERVA